MKKPDIRTLFDHTAKVAEGLKALSGKRLMVGIPQEKGERKKDEDEGPINNAALLYIHENGAPEAGIPARPSLRPGVKSVQGESVKGLRSAAIYAMSGDAKKVDAAFTAVGFLNVNAVKNKIRNGPFVPLKPATIAARRRKGFSGTKPLIRSGQMLRAVTFVIRKV